MSEFSAQTLLETPSLVVRDVRCRGSHAGPAPEEAAFETQLVFPYRGAYVRHLGQDQAVAEANQVLFFNQGDGYRVSHPVSGGDASLTLVVGEPLLRELAPPTVVNARGAFRFTPHRLRIDARAQVLVALLRHGLRQGTVEPLEAESLALTLLRRALGPRTSHPAGASDARRRLVDRVKLVLAGDLARRWTLSDIAAEVRGSPVYLTQAFQQVEGMPLYRYQLRLRLARSLDLLAECDDLLALGLDVGFSSHSHFTSAFRQAYGRTPSELRAYCRQRQSPWSWNPAQK